MKFNFRFTQKIMKSYSLYILNHFLGLAMWGLIGPSTFWLLTFSSQFSGTTEVYEKYNSPYIQVRVSTFLLSKVCWHQPSFIWKVLILVFLVNILMELGFLEDYINYASGRFLFVDTRVQGQIPEIFYFRYTHRSGSN